MPGLFDNSGGGGLLGGLGYALTSMGAAGTDPNAFLAHLEQQRNQQAAYQALRQMNGMPDTLARGAAFNPQQFAPAVQPFMDQAPKIQAIPNTLTGDTNFYSLTGGPHPSVSTVPVQGQGGSGAGISPQPSSIFNQLEGLKAQGADRKAMLQTIPVESGLRNAVEAMLEGGIVPSIFSARGNAHDLAVRIATTIDPTFNEQELGARRKMYTELNSSSPNSIGGILSNGKSAFGHLATVADRLVDLGSAPGPNIPFGGHIGSIENYIGNEVLPSPQTKGKLTGINEALLKYGQEATKFYAGTGGGEAERLHALKTMNPATAIRSEQAEFLKTQRDLMLERLNQKTEQIHTQLGEKAAIKAGLADRDKQNLTRIDAAIAELETGKKPAASNKAPEIRYLNGRAYTRGSNGEAVPVNQ